MDTPWGRSLSHAVSGITGFLTLSSDPSFRKIVSRAYILYCFKIGIPNSDCGYMLGCQSVPYWLGSLELDLCHISYIIGCRNPIFSVWIHLGVVECHTLFIDHCVSFMKIYCLWRYFINNPFLTELYQINIYISLSTQHHYSMIQGKTNSLTSQSCKPLPYGCTSV